MRRECFLICSMVILTICLAQTCDRCICPCTNSYCQTASSKTWNSSYAYSLYGFTKLVLSTNNNSCRPCAYSCKTCTSEDQANCTACMPQFYLTTGSMTCQLCPYRCSSCASLGNITTCTSCSSGSFLDNSTGLCKVCPSGASTCDIQQIIDCQVGFYKISPIVCLPCSQNCQQCVSSQCSICIVGYYKNSTGQCSICNSSLSCLTCITATSCASCSQGYYLTATSPKRCNQCQSNCITCTNSICSQCSANYYLSSGSCLQTTQIINKCQSYNTSSTCSSCLPSFYLLNNQCLPCSLGCSVCIASTFGDCIQCQEGFSLYNMMCLPINYPTGQSFRLFFHLPSFQSLFSGGSVGTCLETAYQGTNLQLKLDNLAASTLSISWKLYIVDAPAAYSVKLNSQNATTYTSTNSVNSICATASQEQYDTRTLLTTNISLNNILLFSSTSTLALTEVVVVAVRCSSLCSECTQTTCSKCILGMLMTQSAGCVFSCSTGYYTYSQNMSCLTVCPPTTYPVSSNLTCQPCQSPCYTCTSSISCLSCTTNYFLLNSTCLTTCPDYYYGSNLTRSCQPCVGRCLKCTSAISCLSCNYGFLNGTICVDNCTSSVTGTYSDMTTLKCELCQTPCLNCSQSASNCTACMVSQPYLISNRCYASCPSGTYASNNSCLKCQYPCLWCSNSSSNCTFCQINFLYQNQCLITCPDGYYEETLNLTCLLCRMGCKTCAYKASFCQQCITGYYLYNNTCLSTCPDGYYGNINRCDRCINPCRTCRNMTYCLTCISNFLNSTTGLCVGQSQCADGFYADMNSLQCQPCVSPCLRCTVRADLCSKCTSPLLLHLGTCVSTCPDYYYASVTVGRCLSCSQPCLLCFNATNCKTCLSGYMYSQTSQQCLSYCLSGQYINIANGTCSSCGSYCLSCKAASSCELCQNGYYLYPLTGSCISNCTTLNNSYYSDETAGRCLLCLLPCSSCSSIVDCQSCLTGVLYQKRCLGTCPIGTYNINTICLNCSTDCFSCSGLSTNCTSCLNRYLYNGQCLVTCPTGTYPELVLLSCQPCNPKCARCQNSTYCQQCQSGFLDLTNNCVDLCSSGYYAEYSNRTCVQCDPKCSTCNMTNTNCLSCSSNLMLIQLSLYSFTCDTQCLSGQYAVGGICYQCTPPCQTCNSSTGCLSCVQGTFLMSSTQSCVTSCPVSTFSNNGSCSSCASKCRSCTSTNSCLTCSNSSLYAHNGDCLETCPEQYYGQTMSRLCVECVAPCKTCTDRVVCLSCTEGYLNKGYCYSICPPGSVSNQTTRTCQTCVSPCMTCIISASYCSKCINGLALFNGTCSSTCPNNTYLSNGICQGCPYPCLTCLNQVVCTSCFGGFLNYLNSTCISGPVCPNDMYNMDGKACVKAEDCPAHYFVDLNSFMCSSSCQLGKYTQLSSKTCINQCPEGYYAAKNLICQSFSTLGTTLLGATAITFIKSSGLYLEYLFNQTVQWQYALTLTTYTVNPWYSETRRLLADSKLRYNLTTDNERIEILDPILSPWVKVRLPAHFISSVETGLPLQTTNIVVKPHPFEIYTHDQKHTGSIIFEVSKATSIILIIVSLGFLYINRLSDVYILWDVYQLVFLLIFIDIQYPPNLNQFILGLQHSHLYGVPNMFSIPKIRQNSTSPYYAYAYDVNFLRGAGHNFLLILIVILAYLLLKLAEFLIRKNTVLNTFPRFKNFVCRGLLRFRWHYTNDVFFLTFLNVLSFVVAQLRDMNSGYPTFGICVALQLICLVTYLGFPIFVSFKLYKHMGNIAKGRLSENLKCFYRGMDKTNRFGVSIILLRYLRKLLFAICIPTLSDRPAFALPILTMSSLLFGIFIIIYKPFKRRISNIVNAVTQLLLVFVYLLISSIYFMAEGSTKEKWMVGWIAVLALMIILFGQLFYLFCKTMFYFQPENASSLTQQQKLQKLKKNPWLMKRIAQDFLNKMFPNLKQNLGLDSSDEEDNHQKLQGDSQNSQNNETFRRAMDFRSELEDTGQKFKHYEGSDSESNKEQQLPKYMIKCVHNFD